MIQTSKLDPKDIVIDFESITYVPENLSIPIFKKVTMEEAQDLIQAKLKVLRRIRKSFESSKLHEYSRDYTCALCGQAFSLEKPKTLYCNVCFNKLYVDEKNYENPLIKADNNDRNPEKISI